MTGVPDTPAFNVADADGVSTVFTFTFFVYETDDIKVYSVLDDVETEITSGITKAINSSFIGGSVTFAAAPADAVGDILIRRELPYTQETEFADITRLKETAIETALNVLALQIQQLRSNSELSPRYSEAAGVTDLTLGTPVDETVLTFDGTTGKIKSGVKTGSINDAAANAAAAATSATAAAASATAAASSATAAASSASAASTSETNAGTSETNAAASATAAAASATAAAASETAAAASETAASTSETNAAASATAAAASETAAATSETNAAASETAAATSESNASTSETNAAASAAAAAASAAEGLYNDVVTLTNADSPYVPSAAEEGTLFRLDMTSGAITINLSALSTYGEDMKFGFVKVDAGGNSATINRGGTDTISGGTSATLAEQYETHVLVGDSATGTWIDTVQSTGIADNTVTNAKLANMAQATIKGRQSGSGTGDPEDLTAAQVRTIIGSASTSQEGLVEKATEAEMQSGTTDKFPDANEVKNYVDGGGRIFATVEWDATTADNKTGTYVRENLNGVWNVNVVGHGVKVGHLIYIDPTSGAAGNDFLLVTAVTDDDNFVGLGNVAGASASGNCTLPFWNITYADGVDNISYEQTTGYGFVNLTDDQGDTNWGMIGQPKGGAGGALLQPYDVSPSGVPHAGQGDRYIRFGAFTLSGTSTNFAKNFATFIK